jgi:hypothetical protein
MFKIGLLLIFSLIFSLHGRRSLKSGVQASLSSAQHHNDSNAGFPLANFLARSDLFPLSVSLITSARRGKMDADKGKRSLRAKKFASGKPA